MQHEQQEEGGTQHLNVNEKRDRGRRRSDAVASPGARPTREKDRRCESETERSEDVQLRLLTSYMYELSCSLTLAPDLLCAPAAATSTMARTEALGVRSNSPRSSILPRYGDLPPVRRHDLLISRVELLFMRIYLPIQSTTALKFLS